MANGPQSPCASSGRKKKSGAMWLPAREASSTEAIHSLLPKGVALSDLPSISAALRNMIVSKALLPSILYQITPKDMLQPYYNTEELVQTGISVNVIQLFGFLSSQFLLVDAFYYLTPLNKEDPR